MKVLLTTLNSKYIHANLGIYSIAAYARAKQLEADIKIREYTVQTPPLSLLADIYALQPDIVAMAVYIWNKEESLKLLAMIHEVLPQCIIVVGGPEVSFDAKVLLEQNSFVDYVVQGEGEEVFADFLRCQMYGLPLPAAISHRRHISAEIAQIANLDNLPLAYHDSLLTGDNANKIVYYESSRGCPYSCSYCLSGISRNVRYRSLDLVLSELDYFIGLNVKQVKFVDRTYNLDVNHYLPIMQHLAQVDTATNFHFEIKADLLTEQLLDFLATVPKGRFQFEIGIQSTHEPTLQAIGRSNNFAHLAYNIKKLLSFGNIHLHTDLIAGLPYEGWDEFAKSFNDVYKLGAEHLQLGFLKMLSGSNIKQQVAEHDYKYMQVPPYEVLSNKYLSYSQLRQLKIIEDVLEKYHNSSKYSHSLQFIIADCYDNDAFAFYNKLSLFAEQHNKHLAALSSRSNMQLLKEFVQCFHADKALYILQLLHLDSFEVQEGWRCEEFNSIIDSEQYNEVFMNFWRDELRVKKYLPDYNLNSWRQIKKLYPMEIFMLDKQRIYMLDSKNSRLIEIAGEDFY